MEKCIKAVEENRAVSFITKLSEQLAESYANGQGVNHNEGSNLPREAEILDILEKLMELIFPGFGKREAYSLATLRFSAAETAAAVYTQTTDVEGEVNGLMTYDRKVIKVDAERLAKINRTVIESM